MDTIKNAVNSGVESVQQAGSGASKEANKSVAKDSDASMGTRAEAGKDAISDKMDETKHSAQSSADKEKAKH